MLRARKPEAVEKRLKLFMFGPAGVGKTTAAIQFPNSYIIDSERGSENYDKLIAASGSVVYPTSDVFEVIQEVKSLLTERHEFRTLVIDPITPIYNDLLEKMEARVGSDHGRHYGAAGKEMKRLANLIMALDMNVIMTAHAKTEYGENLRKLGYTFDGWRSLDYWFDLVIELGKRGKKRMGKVVKTRIETFPDEDVFEWSYDAIKSRYDAATIERPARTVALATPQQVAEICALLNVVRLPEGLVDNWFGRAGVDQWEDMQADVIAKCIDYVKSRAASAEPHRPPSQPARHDATAQAQQGSPQGSAAATGELVTDFQTFWDEAVNIRKAMHVDRQAFNVAMHKFVVAHGGDKDKVPMADLRQLLQAMTEDRFDYEAGEIRQGAASAA